MADAPPHQIDMAIAMLALDAEERAAAARKVNREASRPPAWRKRHSRADRAAAAIAARGQAGQ